MVELVYPEGRWGGEEDSECTLREYRKNARHAAAELGYGKKVVRAVEDAESIGEIERIMSTARHRM